MIDAMIEGIGPLATWVILLGIVPAATLVGVMWSVARITEIWTDRRVAARRESHLRVES